MLAVGVSFWAVTGMLVLMAITAMVIVIFPRAPLVILGGGLLWLALIAAIYPLTRSHKT